MKRVLKESVPGGNPRAEAAEQSLFEIRKALVSLAIKAVNVKFSNVSLVRMKVPTSAFSLTERITRSVYPLPVAVEIQLFTVITTDS